MKVNFDAPTYFPTSSVEYSCLLWSTSHYKSKMGCECRAVAFLHVHMSDISVQEQRLIPWASWREKPVNPGPSNTAPHLHAPFKSE